MRPKNAALVVIWVCLIFVRVRVVREEHRERGVCSRTPLSLVGARPRGRTNTGVGVSCSPAMSDGTCEAAFACRIMRARHSSANSKVVSGTGCRTSKVPTGDCASADMPTADRFSTDKHSLALPPPPLLHRAARRGLSVGSACIKIAVAAGNRVALGNSGFASSPRAMSGFTASSPLPSGKTSSLGHDLSVVVRTFGPCWTPLHGSTRAGQDATNPLSSTRSPRRIELARCRSCRCSSPALP